MKDIRLIVLVAGVAGSLLAFTMPGTTAVRSGRILATAADTAKKDPETGLALDDQLMLVKAHCTSCHSPKLIIQNRFTRDGWKEKIRWMQRTQKLWDLGESEPKVLDYLAKHYGPEAKTFDGRRMPLKDVKWYELKSK